MPQSVMNLTELLNASVAASSAAQYDAAYAIADSAVQIATLTGSRELLGRAYFTRSEGASMRGDVSGAIEDARSAASIFRSHNDSDAADSADARELYLQVDRGDLVRATELAAAPYSAHTVSGATRHGYIGNLLRARGEFKRARVYHDEAAQILSVRAMRDGGNGRAELYSLAFRMDRAIVDALSGKLPAALVGLRSTRSRLRARALNHVHLDALISHYIRLVARMLDTPLKDDEALQSGSFRGALRESVVERLEEASCALHASRTTRARAQAYRNLKPFEYHGWDHARLSYALLRQKFPTVPVETWFAFDGEAFLVCDNRGKRSIDLSRRRALARIIELLVHHHAEAARQSVDPQTLIHYAWPNEIILPGAALNRLYVAIATLRALGLRDLIVRSGRGYALASHVHLAR